MTPLLEIERLTHTYPGRPAPALDGLSLSVNPAEIFGLLGPNGSGKTTLFRILSTLIPPQQGAVTFRFPTQDSALSTQDFPLTLPKDRDPIRQHIGVVFQSPSLDKQLTAEENLRHHAHLYNLRGPDLEQSIDQMLRQVGLDHRPRERVERFSGGMRRRVEIAKGLLTRPRILLLDEPSTGLDPGARIDLWRHLRSIRQSQGVTILLTTHLMEEADHCDRIAILDAGKLAACDTPDALKSRIGADVIAIQSGDPAALAAAIRDRFAVNVEQLDSTLRIERERGHEFIPQLVEAFPGKITSVSLGKPTLEDVFIHATGRAFQDRPALA
jgi:ABC-2 type transport system ATP-binding protein